jgi:hypothetical protein
MIQAAIFITGAIGAALIALGGALAPWGFAVALVGQPFWIAATWRCRQWGMLGLTVWYTGAWALGLARCWGWV